MIIIWQQFCTRNSPVFFTVAPCHYGKLKLVPPKRQIFLKICPSKFEFFAHEMKCPQVIFTSILNFFIRLENRKLICPKELEMGATKLIL